MPVVGYGQFVNDVTKPFAICDWTGILCNHQDLVKQMEWRGNRLTWTGLMVHKDFQWEPCENLRPYKPPPKENVPVDNPRPQQALNILTEYEKMQLIQEACNNAL